MQLQRPRVDHLHAIDDSVFVDFGALQLRRQHPFVGRLHVFGGEGGSIMEGEVRPQHELPHAVVEPRERFGQVRHRFAAIVKGHEPGRDELSDPLPNRAQRQAVVERVWRRLDNQRDAALRLRRGLAPRTEENRYGAEEEDALHERPDEGRGTLSRRCGSECCKCSARRVEESG